MISGEVQSAWGEHVPFRLGPLPTGENLEVAELGSGLEWHRQLAWERVSLALQPSSGRASTVLRVAPPRSLRLETWLTDGQRKQPRICVIWTATDELRAGRD